MDVNKMDNNLKTTNINFYPGHMAKARRLIAEKYPLIDIVYEVVYARIPKKIYAMKRSRMLGLTITKI